MFVYVVFYTYMYFVKCLSTWFWTRICCLYTDCLRSFMHIYVLCKMIVYVLSCTYLYFVKDCLRSFMHVYVLCKTLVYVLLCTYMYFVQ